MKGHSGRKTPQRHSRDAVRTTIVGGRPPGNGVIPRHIPRGLEVLIKKAAVDPSFKKLLLEKRSEAAQAIALMLEPAEAAMVNAVPEAQLEAIVANTKVTPSLRPAFLGYAAAAMLAAVGTATTCGGADVSPDVTRGIEPDIPPAIPDEAETPSTAEIGEDIAVPADTGVITGTVSDNNGDPISGAFIQIEKTNLYANSSSDGKYVIKAVPPGKYKIKVSRVGFEKGKAVKIEVKVGEIINVSFSLAAVAVGGIRPDRP